MFKHVRGPITEHVFKYARGKMPDGFADIAGITARTKKNLYTAPASSPQGIGSFTPNMLPILKHEKTNF